MRYDIVPDEVDIIRRRLIEWADAGDVDVILTTGGTGLGPRDVTPEATMPILDKTGTGYCRSNANGDLRQNSDGYFKPGGSGRQKEMFDHQYAGQSEWSA